MVYKHEIMNDQGDGSSDTEAQELQLELELVAAARAAREAEEGLVQSKTEDSEESVEASETTTGVTHETQKLKPMKEIELIYNKSAMQHHLATMMHHKTNNPALREWVETLDISSLPLQLEASEILNVHDDLKREMTFYTHALASVKLAKAKLESNQIAYQRPEDYFAEMLKSDAHMAKIKDKLIYEQKKMTAVEERKKSIAHKKIAKQLQSDKLKSRAQDKRETLEAVKQWKRKRDPSGNNTNNNKQDSTKADAQMEQILSNNNKAQQQFQNTGRQNKTTGKQPESDGLTRKSRKRQQKDAKFGFGGAKRHAKSNDKSSVNDDRKSFSLRRNNEHVGKHASSDKKKHQKKGGAQQQQRPGKSSRDKKRQRR